MIHLSQVAAPLLAMDLGMGMDLVLSNEARLLEHSRKDFPPR